MGVDANKLIETPLGVDLGLFRPKSIPRKNDTFRVIFVGQITQRKGLSYLLEGYRRAALPNSELMLVGQPCVTDAPWRNVLGLRHLPRLPREDLPDLYASADVFVLPSLIEGFPQTALEAMACGLPVIVSEHTFGGDVITDGVNGYIVPIRDPDQIADRLRHLYDHPNERRRLGLAARRRAEKFSWEGYGHRIVNAIANTGVTPL
jgi:glycosyltransferase involved in cell wall biosynthesis